VQAVKRFQRDEHRLQRIVLVADGGVEKGHDRIPDGEQHGKDPAGHVLL
jgi:hypothetical protein